MVNGCSTDQIWLKWVVEVGKYWSGLNWEESWKMRNIVEGEFEIFVTAKNCHQVIVNVNGEWQHLILVWQTATPHCTSESQLGMGTLGSVKVKVLELQNQTQGTDPSVYIIIKTMKSQKKTVHEYLILKRNMKRFSICASLIAKEWVSRSRLRRWRESYPCNTPWQCAASSETRA